MQFTIRQLLFCFTGLAVWIKFLTKGHHLFGFAGAITFGTLYGASILCCLALIHRWVRWSVAERAYCIVALFLSLAAGFLVQNEYLDNGFHREQEKVRRAQYLQAKLLTSERMKSVQIIYEWNWHPFAAYGTYGSRRLLVSGTVLDQKDLETLQQMVESEDKWYVEWEVAVINK